MNEHLDGLALAVTLLTRVERQKPLTPEQKKAIQLRNARILEEQAFERKLAEYRKVAGRNDPCPCGSGVKLKRCCMIFKPKEVTDEQK